jgi:RNA polymerase sigma-B factor
MDDLDPVVSIAAYALGGMMGPTSTVRLRSRTNQLAGDNELLIAFMPMASRIAWTFAGRGEDIEDLIQVAMVELVKASARFDPARGVPFARYAYPCIAGGLKRHFRNNAWSLHVTRRVQELYLATNHAIPGLTQELGHHPSVAELAIHMRLSEKDTRDGMEAGLAYQTRSLSGPVGEGDESEAGHLIGEVDEQLESVPERHMLRAQVAALPSREQDIVRLRFVDGLSQREIADQIGISQMHVSRLLAHSMGRLKAGLLARGRNV